MKDREAWCAAVQGVTKSWTQLSDWTTKYITGSILLKLLTFYQYEVWTITELLIISVQSSKDIICSFFIIDIANPALLGSWGSSQWLNSPMITGHLISIEFIHLGILKRWLLCLYTNDQYSRAAVVPVMTLTWWLPYSYYLGGFSSWNPDYSEEYSSSVSSTSSPLWLV